MNYDVILSDIEKQWLLESRITRLTDNKEVQIYPMGAERYLASVLKRKRQGRYELCADVLGKDILIIPGYGNSAFLFAQAGAKSITVYDKDPVTIAWIKAFKKYYHYRGEVVLRNLEFPSVGELLDALTCWYPPCLVLPLIKYKINLLWLTNPQALRRLYIFRMLSLVRQAIQREIQNEFELDQNIYFGVGELNAVINDRTLHFDTAFIPYLLGVQNGIEKEDDIVQFIEALCHFIPNGQVLVNPSRNTREFYILGKRYFCTTNYSSIHMIPQLKPYFKKEDGAWFHTQGIAVFSKR